METKEELVKAYWENEIRAQLDPISKESGNLLYYVFQTPYRFNPDLLIVGMNPGGDYKGVPFLDRSTSYYTDCKNDPQAFGYTICSVFGHGENQALWQLLENAVGTNRVFFNTGNEQKLKKLPRYKEIVAKCSKITHTLIDEYIQPKKILTLGNDPFDCVKTTKGYDVIKVGDVVIKKSYRNEIPVCNIPNPSKRNRRYYKPEQIKQYQLLLEKELLG